MTFVRQLSSALVPPRLFDALEGLRSYGVRSYDSFQSADATGHDSYNGSDVPAFVCARAKALIAGGHASVSSLSDAIGLSQILPVLLLGLRRKRPLNVIDFGGAIGLHALLVSELLEESDSVHWNVVELPSMVSMARSTGIRDVHFHSSISEATDRLGHVDVVFSSGTVHYTPDPNQTLSELAEIGAETICLARLPLSNRSQTIYLRQRAPLSAHGYGPLPESFVDRTVSHTLAVMPLPEVHRAIGSSYECAATIADPKERLVFRGRIYPYYHLLHTKRTTAMAGV